MVAALIATIEPRFRVAVVLAGVIGLRLGRSSACNAVTWTSPDKNCPCADRSSGCGRSALSANRNRQPVSGAYPWMTTPRGWCSRAHALRLCGVRGRKAG